MAYKNLTNEQASKLAQTLGPEFTAAAKNDLINFADAVLGLAERADAPFEVPEVKTFVAKQPELKIDEPKAAKAPAKGRSI